MTITPTRTDAPGEQGLVAGVTAPAPQAPMPRVLTAL